MLAKASINLSGNPLVDYEFSKNNDYMFFQTTYEADFMSLEAGDTAPTTKLTLSFNKNIPGLTADNLTVIGAAKGTLTKDAAVPGKYTLEISNITVADNATVTVTPNKTGFSFTPASRSVPVRAHAPAALPISITPNATFPVGACGGDRTVTVGHGTSLIASEIGALSVGNNTLTEGTDYTKETASSVNITLRESWLNSLPAGTHRLNVPITSGTYAPQTPYINIVVTAPGAGGDVGADVPKTGDGSMPLLWAGLALLAGAGLVVRRKRRRA